MQSGLRGIAAPIGIGNLRYKPAGVGARSRLAQTVLRDVMNARDFGVTAKGRNDDTASLQKAVNAAIFENVPLLLPIGTMKFSSELAVPGAITIIGYGHTQSVLSPVSTTQNGIRVTAVAPVFFKDFGIDAQGITPTAGKGILFDPGGSSRNAQSRLNGVRVIGTFQGIDFERAAYWVMDGCAVQECKDAHIIVKNLVSGDEGDSVISNSLISYNTPSPSPTILLILQKSSGGLRLNGNKIMGGYHGYHMALEAGVTTLGPIITGNSFENQDGACIFMGSDNPATSQILRTVITGNELAPFNNGYGIQVAAASTPSWCTGLTITGNDIATGINGSGTTGIGIHVDFAQLVTIVGNTLRGNGGTTIGINLTANTSIAGLGLNALANFGTAISDSSTSPMLETFKGTVTTLDTYRARGNTPGFWLDETDGGVKGAYTVLDGGDLQMQRRATNFGAFEATLYQVNLASALATFFGPVKPLVTAVASLPAAATAGAGAQAFVTNANATTFASIVAGGGANGVSVYSDGTNWRIG